MSTCPAASLGGVQCAKAAGHRSRQHCGPVLVGDTKLGVSTWDDQWGYIRGCGCIGASRCEKCDAP